MIKNWQQHEGLLRQHQMRVTEIRLEVLQAFMQAGHAIAHSYVEEQLGDRFDRVTLYRTLKTFEEKGLIHRVVNDRDVIEYALCKADCSGVAGQGHDHHHHQEGHIHFRCETCERTFCVEGSHLPTLHLPEGYEVHAVQVLAVGLCQQCRHR